MLLKAWSGILVPFAGSVLGAAMVFFFKKSINPLVQRALSGFAAGIMLAASIWSLIIPAVEQSEYMGALSFLPAAVGFWAGVLFLQLIDGIIKKSNTHRQKDEHNMSRLDRIKLLVFAVTLHNIPEGMAVGVVYVGCLSGSSDIMLAGAIALAVGIAIQNFPEGAIISMPLRAEGFSRKRAFLYGIASSAVEPLGAIITVLAAPFITALLPYLLSFAAGAMIYVVVEELIPEMHCGKPSPIGSLMLAAGFSVMMTLDIALG